MIRIRGTKNLQNKRLKIYTSIFSTILRFSLILQASQVFQSYFLQIYFFTFIFSLGIIELHVFSILEEVYFSRINALVVFNLRLRALYPNTDSKETVSVTTYLMATTESPIDGTNKLLNQEWKLKEKKYAKRAENIKTSSDRYYHQKNSL